MNTNNIMKVGMVLFAIVTLAAFAQPLITEMTAAAKTETPNKNYEEVHIAFLEKGYTLVYRNTPLPNLNFTQDELIRIEKILKGNPGALKFVYEAAVVGDESAFNFFMSCLDAHDWKWNAFTFKRDGTGDCLSKEVCEEIMRGKHIGWDDRKKVFSCEIERCEGLSTSLVVTSMIYHRIYPGVPEPGSKRPDLRLLVLNRMLE